jgi:hypothetical protein
MHRFCFYFVDYWVLWKRLWVYLTFDNTKTSDQVYAENAPAPANSITGQLYNFMEGIRCVRSATFRFQSAPFAYLSTRSTDSTFGMKVTFLTTRSLPQIASIWSPTYPENVQKLLSSVYDMTCFWLVLLERLGISFPAQSFTLTAKIDLSLYF